MKILVSLLLLIVVFSIFTTCVNKNNIKYKKITPKEAKEAMEKDKNIVLLDVRTKEEYKSEHIKDSISIPLDTLKEKVFLKIKDKEVKIFVYCRSGNRSKVASQLLIKMGYTNVYDLGGINDWPYEKE